MEFPPFEHLRFYEGVHDVRLNISYSNIKGFTLGEFHKTLPKDLDLNWTDERGPPELRRLIARHARVAMDHVLVTTGATEANFLANVALVQPRDRVVVDPPNYSPLRDCAVRLGADVVPVVRDCHDGWSLDLDRFRKTAGGRAKLLVFANLNNPTSVPLGRNDLQELADIAQECDGYDLVDETFRELAFHHPPPSVAEFGPRMIALSTVTKVGGLGALRVGWIVAHPRLLERFKAVKDYTTVCGSSVSQLLATWALHRWSPFRHQGAEIGTTASSCVQDDHRGRTVLRRGRSFPNRPGWRPRRIPSRSTESREGDARTRMIQLARARHRSVARDDLSLTRART